MTLPIPAAHARELARLRSLHPDLPIVVIGAAALGHHVVLSRTTADVDLVIVVGPGDVPALIEPLGWKQDRSLSIRWHGPDGFRTDVIPVSDELLAAGELRLDDGHTMNLLGLDLALEHATEVELLDTRTTIRVASAAALTVLKMVAWIDRPTERTRDLGDLAALLAGVLDELDERRWEPTHPVGAAELDYDQQSPWFVGLCVGEIANDQHREAIGRFLEALLAEDGRWSATMARSAGYPSSDGDDRVRAMLESFRAGLAATAGGH